MADIKEILISSQVSRVNPKDQSALGKAVQKPDSGSFDKALDSAELNISKHALRRLDSRKIELSAMDRTRLSDALSSLERKGAKDSLVLMGDKAFVVNVPSKTVVTALEKGQMKEHVFTNIDSTILVDQ